MELAAGGMGVVYVARRTGAAGFARLVVVKRMLDELAGDPAFRKMLHEEARLMSFVHDAHVVSVLDVVESGGRLSLVLEYVESMSLAALVKAARARGERLPVPIAARIVADALAGLHAAHEARGPGGDPLGIVHRDVSPQNVIVGFDGTSRLIDFGIAKATSQPGETQSGVLKGKLRYMSPEQVKQLPLDRQTDVFSAGVVLYESLTGERMFRSEDEADLLLSLLLGDIRPPREHVPELAPELEAVVLRALAREREERFATAAAFQEALERATPVASTREVARYVHEHGGAAIEARRAQIAELAAAADRAARASTRRRALVVTAVATAAMATVATVAWASRHASAAPPPVAVASAAMPPASAPADVAVLSAAPPAGETVATRPPAAPAKPHAIARQPSAREARPTPRPKPPSCSPPYDVLADGTHRFKIECIE